MGEKLELETRRRVFSTIEKNPGIHLSKIAQLLDLRVSHVEYHVNQLEHQELVNVEKSTGYKRYYVRGEVGVAEKKILNVLRQKVILEIIRCLLDEHVCSHKKLSMKLDIAPSTLSYHLKKLMKREIIKEVKTESTHGFSLIDENLITRVLIRYRPFDLFDDFADVWSDFSV